MKDYKEKNLPEDIILEVNHLKKKFCRSIKKNMVYSMLDMLSFIFTGSVSYKNPRKDEFLALNDINFHLKKGESLGIIGLNGSGKSTLLRIISGIYPPSSGEVSTKGRIGALIAVGAGFHDQMSGRDNIYLNGSILGMSKEEIDKEFDSIINFAELGDFLEAPVQSYSSGMRVRLGFSIAVHADIDILIADEVLSVGDSSFKMKCFNKLGELRKKGVSIILVSHDSFTITGNCTKAVYLKKGEMVFFGDVYKASALYQKDIMEKEKKLLTTKQSYQDYIFFSDQDKDFKIKNITFNKIFEEGFLNLKTHDDLILSFYYEAKKDIDSLRVNYNIMINKFSQFFARERTNEESSIKIKKGSGVIKIIVKDINIVSSYGEIRASLFRGKREDVFAYIDMLPIKIESSSDLSSLDTIVHYEYDLIVEDNL